MTLSISGIKKHYRIAGSRRIVLDGIDLDVRAGEIISITGQSGCGKTTLLNVISGVTTPDSGKVVINGKKIHYVFDFQPARRRNREIGFVFQTFRLLSDETVMSNVLLPARIRGRVGKETKEYVNDILGRLKIYKYRSMKTGLLSGGQKQRVAIARALVNDPLLILADEPTANLDRQTAIEIFDILIGLRNEGKSIIVVTHTDYMHDKSDAVYTMDKGKIEAIS